MLKCTTVLYYLFKTIIKNRNKFKMQGIHKIFNKVVEKLEDIKILKTIFKHFN